MLELVRRVNVEVVDRDDTAVELRRIKILDVAKLHGHNLELVKAHCAGDVGADYDAVLELAERAELVLLLVRERLERVERFHCRRDTIPVVGIGGKLRLAERRLRNGWGRKSLAECRRRRLQKGGPAVGHEV